MIRRMSIMLGDSPLVFLDREDHSNGYPIFNGVMYCPVCCKIWAWLAYLEGGDLSLSEPRMIPCDQHPEACHPDLRPVAGSLIDNPTANGYDVPLLEALPESLLRREFELHMKSSLIQELGL